MVSKKSESMKLMTASTAVRSPSLAKKPKLNWPTSEKSGPASGSAGSRATSPGTRKAMTVAIRMPARMRGAERRAP